MRPILLICTAVVGLGLGLPAPAASQVYGGTIAGHVTQVVDGLAGIALGDPVRGAYRYDPVVVPDDETGDLINPLTSFSLSIGAHTFSLADLDIDAERVACCSTPAADSLEFFFQPEVITGILGRPVAGQQITTIPPQTLSVRGPAGNLLQFEFTAAPVPEPSPMAMLAGLGAGGCLLLARPRRRLLRWRAVPILRIPLAMSTEPTQAYRERRLPGC